MLVIDEADLMFSFGFENDLKIIFEHLPATYQVGLIIVLNLRILNDIIFFC